MSQSSRADRRRGARGGNPTHPPKRDAMVTVYIIIAVVIVLLSTSGNDGPAPVTPKDSPASVAAVAHTSIPPLQSPTAQAPVMISSLLKPVV